MKKHKHPVEDREGFVLIVTGGGTGGHIYPALAIAQEVKKRFKGAQVIFAGNPQGLEARVVPKEGITFAPISSAGFPRSFSPKKIVFGFMALVKGLKEALQLIREKKPDAVVGTGGYVCFPVVLAAILRGVPTLLHESNLIPGVAVRLLAPFVKQVMVAFPQTRRKLWGKSIETGTPISPEILTARRKNSYEAFGLDPSKFTVFVLGGSQGAHSINLAMVDALFHLAEGKQPPQVLFMTGYKDYQFVLDSCEKQALRAVVKPFLFNMPQAYAVADLVVCRAGAMTLAEVTARGLPALLVPYPFAAHDHQRKNAQVLVRAGAAVMLADKELNGMLLSEHILGLIHDPEKYRTMAAASKAAGQPEAGKKIFEEIGHAAGRSMEFLNPGRAA